MWTTWCHAHPAVYIVCCHLSTNQSAGQRSQTYASGRCAEDLNRFAKDIANKILNSGLLYIYYTPNQRENDIQLPVICFINPRNWIRTKNDSTIHTTQKEAFCACAESSDFIHRRQLFAYTSGCLTDSCRETALTFERGNGRDVKSYVNIILIYIAMCNNIAVVMRSFYATYVGLLATVIKQVLTEQLLTFIRK